MRVQEFYDWTMNKGVEDCDLVVRNVDGSYSHDIEPFIIVHLDSDGEEYYEVGLQRRENNNG